VVDDLPGVVPVVRREIVVIETYLAALLDECLEPGGRRKRANAKRTSEKR
jgi:hypothetical protein